MPLDVEMYRRTIPVPGEQRSLSVIDIEPEEAIHTVVFVHGYGGNALQWLYQLRFFAQWFRVLAPDLRGHGHSDDLATLPYTMDGLVDDLELVLQTLQVVGPFSLIAHSFGGAVATEYVLRHPNAVTGLALIGVPSRFILRPWIRRLIQIPDPIFSFLAQKFHVALFAKQHTLKEMLRHVMEVWPGWIQLPKLLLSTLVIMGQRDSVFLREHYEDLPRSIPQAQRVVISVSAHLVQLERPDAVNRSLRRFLEAVGVVIKPLRSVENGEKRLTEMPWLQHYDDGIPAQLPLPKQCVHEMLSQAAHAYPHHPALIFFGQRIGYRELDLLSNRLAHALRSLGVQPGDRIAVVLPNIPQCVFGFYGILKVGGVVVLGSPLSNEDEIHWQLRDSGATILLTLTSYRPVVEKICPDTHIKQVIYTDVREYLPLPQRLRIVSRIESSMPHREQTGQTLAVARASASAPLFSWHEYSLQHLLRQQPTDRLEKRTCAQDLALLQYTSGTTDTPKGVILTHGNLMINVLQVRHWLSEARRGCEVTLDVLPLSHSYGVTGAMQISIALAGTLVLLPTDRIDEVMQMIKEYRPSILPGIPALYLAIANYPQVRRFGVSAIRFCVSGSAPLPVEVQEAFEKLTKGHLVEGYGLTEASPVTHSNPLKGERRVGSIGLPLPGTQAKIVDVKTGDPLPIGEVGELLVRGPQIMQGYWQMPEETAQVLRDGWLHTGDLARMDEDGFFTIVERKRDLILVGPYNIYPREVEEVLYEHPKVLEAAVVGAGNTGSPSIKAVVVLKRGEQATADELLALCRERLDSYEVPRQIEFRSALPKNIVGKVLRRLLIEA